MWRDYYVFPPKQKVGPKYGFQLLLGFRHMK